MENNIDANQEKTIIKRQYRALISALIFLVLFGILATVVFPTLLKYVVLIAILPMFYIAVSSIKNRVSIFRFKRMHSDYARGAPAVIFGILFLIVEIAMFIFILSPFSDSYFNF